MKKIILKFVVFSCLFAVIFHVIGKSFIVIDNVDLVNIDGFFCEKENTADIVLMGQSEIYRGFAPALAWKEYGIKSLDLSVGDSPCSQYISMTKEIIKRQNPKLLVVNATAFLHGDDDLDNEILLRKWIDNMPVGANKLETIRDTVPADKNDNMLVSIGKYHGNWKYPQKVLISLSLRSHLLVNRGGYLKGFYTRSQSTGGKQNLAKIGWPTEEKYVLTDRCKTYLNEFLQYCVDNGVKQLLMLVPPHQTTATDVSGIEAVRKIVSDFRYDFMDLHDNYSDIGIDDSTDFGDYEHLNVYGAEKMTAYLGKFIVDNYDVMSDSTDEEVRYWNECVEKTEDVVQMSKDSMAIGKNHGYGEASITAVASVFHFIRDNVLD